MIVFRCKMCGGDIELLKHKTSATCTYCGTEQTLPSDNEQQLEHLFNRATQLRMQGEYDSARLLYEQLLGQKPQEAEAYWGLVLCKYGIEYVKDPATNKYIPTCHRASYESVLKDEDYAKACQFGDVVQQRIYTREAEALSKLQRQILTISNREDNYDIFICYKESDQGTRTYDSGVARELYEALTKAGYRTFFAPVTLEDKVGLYEPYIFAALNSAKVMLVLGSKAEYFNAVWVKNEWSRFLKLKEKHSDKILIPCYKDLDPYEMPEEFTYFQAQDMGRIGFVSDILRGIGKVLPKNAAVAKGAVAATAMGQQTVYQRNIENYLTRGFMAIEDKEWKKANSFFEKALNFDPHCGKAYVGKLLARDQKVSLRHWQEEKILGPYTLEKREIEWSNDEIDAVLQNYTINYYYEYIDIFKDLGLDSYKALFYYDSYIFIFKNRDPYSIFMDDEGFYNDVIRHPKFMYGSYIVFYEERKEKLLMELDSDILLKRCLENCQGELLEEVKNAVADIKRKLDNNIARAVQAEKDDIEKFRRICQEAISSRIHMVEANYAAKQQQREADYNKALEILENTSWHLETSDIQRIYEYLRNLLAKIGYYKDARDRLIKLDSLIEAKKNEHNRIAKIRQAKHEEARKINKVTYDDLENEKTYCGCGCFLVPVAMVVTIWGAKYFPVYGSFIIFMAILVGLIMVFFCYKRKEILEVKIAYAKMLVDSNVNLKEELEKFDALLVREINIAKVKRILNIKDPEN